jgi:tryptophan halogenase
MMQSARLRIVIAGGGTAGWMAAAAIGRTLGPAVERHAGGIGTIGTVGVGESTIPARHLQPPAGHCRGDFMRATQATFKLGIAFENWKQMARAISIPLA